VEVAVDVVSLEGLCPKLNNLQLQSEEEAAFAMERRPDTFNYSRI